MHADENWRLIIRNLHDDTEHVQVLADDDSLDLRFHVESWIEKESGGCLRLAPDSLGPVPGAHLAIITDDPREVSCWDVGYFDTEAVPE